MDTVHQNNTNNDDDDNDDDLIVNDDDGCGPTSIEKFRSEVKKVLKTPHSVVVELRQKSSELIKVSKEYHKRKV